MKQDRPEHPPRAQRYILLMSMLYREAGDPTWHEGRTENVSRSGVLFLAEHLIEPDTSIEMVLMIPMEIAGDTAGKAMCHGRIVRAVDPVNLEARPALAAYIFDYEPILQDPRRI